MDVLHAGSADDYLSQLTSFAAGYGFGLISASVIVDHSPTLTEFSCITNAPKEYLEIFNDIQKATKDPVCQHCRVSSTTLIWNSRTYVDSGCASQWEEQAAFGFKEGIALAMHLPHGKHFFIGMDYDGKIGSDQRSISRLSSDFRIYASYAQAAAFELVLAPGSDRRCKAISQHELEALWLSMDGNSAADIATRIGVSERTIDLRLKTAMTKLGCGTKYEAALRAIRQGYIRP